MDIYDFGFTPFFEACFAQHREDGLEIGRVFVEHRHFYGIYTEKGEAMAEISGKMRFEASERGDYPAVGDFVAISPVVSGSNAIIHAILPRKSSFSRKVPGDDTREQIVAANIDSVFILTSLNEEFSLRRIERYLTLIYESSAKPVIVLNKTDLCENFSVMKAQVEAAAPGVEVYAVSALTGAGIDEIKGRLLPRGTFAFMGSSGVGKSTLINRLAGVDVQQVSEISGYDDRGRHTTTRRELIILPSGALVMDTPGMRELQMWEGGDGLAETFNDIEEIARGCRFGDCRHEKEPGCAVQAALADGSLDAGRFGNYKKMLREIEHFKRRQDVRARLDEQKRWKNIAKAIRNYSKETRYKV